MSGALRRRNILFKQQELTCEVLTGISTLTNLHSPNDLGTPNPKNRGAGRHELLKPLGSQQTRIIKILSREHGAPVANIPVEQRANNKERKIHQRKIHHQSESANAKNRRITPSVPKADRII